MKKILYIIISFLYLNASALSYLNEMREKSGLGKLQYSKTLEISALKHAIYLANTGELGHYEYEGSKYFYGKTPWDRTTKAGLYTRVAVENISFYEPNYKASIDTLMGTVYHRLAFLDFRVDTIGFASYKKRYVYDMSNSKINSLCKKRYNVNYGVEDLCKDRNIILPQELYNKAILSTLKRSKKVSFYPYKNQKDVPLKLIEERPSFLYGKYGLPISVRFNNYYVKSVKLISFKLYQKGSIVNSRIVTFSNDIQGKLDRYTFVLVPLSYLKSKTKYKVVLKVNEDGKIKTYKWHFTTK